MSKICEFLKEKYWALLLIVALVLLIASFVLYTLGTKLWIPSLLLSGLIRILYATLGDKK